ncbi:MAG: beta-ketoacyl-ACP synthase II [Caldisericia bacterium]|nr:beta-ketoacyl-ACP synthase II [Caldisericia bacterium]
MRRVVVTGMGVISPIGKTLEEFKNNLFSGKSGVSKITLFNPEGFDVQIAAEVKDFDLRNYEKDIKPIELKRIDRFSQFAIAASYLALEDSGLELSKIDPYRVGVIIASGIGGIISLEEGIKNLITKGPNLVSPYLAAMMIPNMATGWVSMKLKITGYNSCPTTACSAGATAIGEAYEAIKRGDSDIIFAGGTEASICPIGIASFSQAKALSTSNEIPEKASRPFDKLRNGFVMGEGAGVLVLEDLEHAKKRGAKIYAEVISYGQTSDAYHITAPEPTGIPRAKAIEIALNKGNVPKDEIDYINAHGTSTPLNDKVESDTIKQVFGERAYKIPISSTKSMTGHLLGAAGAVEAIATILCIKENFVHPTINQEVKDPDCDLDYVPNIGREYKIKYALSNSFGFGGVNTALIFKKFI